MTRKGLRWDVGAGRWRTVATGAFAAAPKKRARAAPARTRAAPAAPAGMVARGLAFARALGIPIPPPPRRPTPPPPPRQLVDIASLHVAAYRPAGVGKNKRDWPEAADVCVDALQAVRRVLPVASSFSQDDEYRATLTLASPLSSADLGPLMSRISLGDDALRGGRLHFSATTVGGTFVPITYAFETSDEVWIMAEDEFDDDLDRYLSEES